MYQIMYTCALKYIWHLQRRAKASKSCEGFKTALTPTRERCIVAFRSAGGLATIGPAAPVHRAQPAHRSARLQSSHYAGTAACRFSSSATADRRWVLTVAGVDSQCTCIPMRSLHSSRCHVAPVNRRIYYITLNVISGVYNKTTRLSFHPVAGSCLALSIRSLIFRAYQLHTECFFYFDYNNYFIFYLNWNVIFLLYMCKILLNIIL